MNFIDKNYLFPFHKDPINPDLPTFFVIAMKKFYPLLRGIWFLLTGSRFQKIIHHYFPWFILG
jgi:hypothetical protein